MNFQTNCKRNALSLWNFLSLWNTLSLCSALSAELLSRNNLKNFENCEISVKKDRQNKMRRNNYA